MISGFLFLVSRFPIRRGQPVLRLADFYFLPRRLY